MRTTASFLVFLAVLATALSRVAFVESHWDEDACVTIGWLLSKGWTLYSSVFTHHMPLDYLPSWALASAFGARFAVFRGFMIAVWAAACLGVHAAWRRREPGRWPLGAWLFALLSSQWLTYWMGQMMLVESYWAYLVALLLALLGSPLGLAAAPVGRAEAAAAGALLGTLLSASPTCAPAFACLAVWAAREPAWRARWKPLLAGFFGWLALLLAWCAGHADLARGFSDVWTFNSEVYARYYGFSGPHPLLSLLAKSLRDNAAYFARAMSWGDFEQYFEGVLRLGVLAWVGLNAARGRLFDAALWVVLVLALRSRSERFAAAVPFHSGPFFLAATLLLSRELELAWARARRRPVWMRAAALAAGAFFFFPTLLATSWAAASLKRHAAPNAQYEQLVAALRGCAAPQDRLAVFPFYPRFYLDTGLLPATPSVFYLPWQHDWPPQREATMDALRAAPPKAVIIQRTRIWGVAWDDYGAAINAWVAANYLPVTQSATGEELRLQLWVRKDAARAFVACAQRL